MTGVACPYSTEGFRRNEYVVDGVRTVVYSAGQGPPVLYLHGGGSWHGFEWARDWLHHVSHIVGLLAARAGERNSPYALLLEVLVEYAEGNLELGALRRRASEEPRDDTHEAIDALWEEEAVRFGNEAPDGNCSPKGPQHARPEGLREVRS